jgi:hypothetical protein
MEFKEKMKKVFISTPFVLIVLCLLFFVEWLIFSHFNGNLTNGVLNIGIYWIALGCLLLLSILVIGCLLKAYKLNIQIIKRLLNNTFALRWLSLIFILGFLVHISWISNIAYSIVVDNKENIFQLPIAVFGLLYLCWIFPIRERKRVSEEDKSIRTLLVTGITVPINIRSLNLLFKPFEPNSGYHNIKDVIIISSTRMYNGNEENSSISALRQIIQDEKVEDFKKIIEKSPLSKGMEYDLNCINSLIGADSSWVNDYLRYLKDENHNKLKEITCNILLQYLRKQFPAYNDKEVIFQFTSTDYNYNDFDSCYNAVGEILKKHEKGRKDRTYETLIHISPGTAIVSAAMALHAIKESRALVYTGQDSFTLTAFDVNVWSIEDLLNELWRELDE